MVREGARLKHERYRELREAAGLGVRELAKALDISPTYVSQVETGKEPRGYSRTTTYKLLIALKADKNVAKELLSEWLAFHSSEVAAIHQFIDDIDAPHQYEPCPFCTSKDIDYWEDIGFNRVKVVCQSCKASTRFIGYDIDDYELSLSFAISEAIAIWNTRIGALPQIAPTATIQGKAGGVKETFEEWKHRTRS